MNRVTKIAPSILSADFACLADDVARVATEADLLHVDVMDGHFVPNLTIGPPVVAALRARTPLFLDCHLMVDNPAVLLADFAEAGADRCIVHIEVGDPRPLFAELRERGVGVGLTLSPETPVETVLPFLGEIDLLLVMSVHPGFGGQSFIPDVLDKVRVARRAIDEAGLPVEIEIDGGIKLDTAREAVMAGVDILVAGSAIFAEPDPAAAARALPRRGATRCLSDAVPGHPLLAKVLTVSDGVVAGTRDDRSGTALVDRLTAAGFDVVAHDVCADGVESVSDTLRSLTEEFAGLVVTTGGTGFGPRDCTPEGTLAVIDRRAPGLAEAMRRASDGDGRGFGMLSRGVCGTVDAALVCNLPGSSSGAVECLEAILPVVPHALDLLAGGRPH